MNVNSDDDKKPEPTKRIRRTPEEARSLILQTAANRLATMGMDGLNISGVAKAAGMSHGTVIHHFGSTEAMRQALLRYMTENLLADVVSALKQDVPHADVMRRLFDTLSQDGHGRLVAWLSLENQMMRLPPTETSRSLFADIIATISEKEADGARQQVLLVASAALGFSLCGDVLANLVGMSDDESAEFPAWLAARLQN